MRAGAHRRAVEYGFQSAKSIVACAPISSRHTETIKASEYGFYSKSIQRGPSALEPEDRTRIAALLASAHHLDFNGYGDQVARCITGWIWRNLKRNQDKFS